MAATIQDVVRAYATRETIPVESATKLIAILERANNEALRLIYRERVKFCWPIARRILKDRGQPV